MSMKSFAIATGASLSLAVSMISAGGGPAVAAAPTTAFRQISAGYLHTCAVTPRRAALCWGSNDHGELGDGTTTNRLRPVPVAGLGSGVLAIGAGAAFSCALMTSGAVKCWGANDHGQLGDGTTTERHTPRTVSGLTSGVRALRVAGLNACVITVNNAARCWGGNLRGSLGDGTTTNRTRPVQVRGLASAVASIAPGITSSCATMLYGAAKCWGANDFGQLGNGTTTDSLTPVTVTGLETSATEVIAGSGYACSLTTFATVKCWGWNDEGELGDGTTAERHTPVDVIGLSGIYWISGFDTHTCARTSVSGMMCWGTNWYGELGDGTKTNRTVPVPVVGLRSDVTSVSAGGWHSCALLNGVGKCWGYGGLGELGTGGRASSTVPVTVL